MTQAPHWRVDDGRGGATIASPGVTVIDTPRWSGVFERTSFGGGFHMQIGRLKVTEEAEIAVSGDPDGPLHISAMAFFAGRARLRLVDWPELELGPRRAVLFRPRERLGHFTLAAPQTVRFLSVAVAPRVMAELLGDKPCAALHPLAEPDGTDTHALEADLSPALQRSIARLGDPGAAAPIHRLHREAVALQLLTEIVQAHADQDGAGAAEPRLTAEEIRLLHEARARLLDDLRDPPTAHDLSQAAGLGLRRFLKGFEALHGSSPAQLLRAERMAGALKLLAEDNLSLKEAAWRVGYSHANNFIAAFTVHFGMPPRRFLREGRDPADRATAGGFNS